MHDKVNEIRKIRIQNNDLWMDILDIALHKAPEATKLVLQRIKQNDTKISNITQEIIDENSR